MTLLTVIVSAVVLLKFGLSGTTGIFFVMALAGMVCVALCASGQFITDLKAGYWIGSTPSAQEKVKFIGVIASAITAGLTIILLAKAFQFGEAVPGDPRQVLVAPQASALKAVVSGFMSGQPVAYMLFGIGAMVTVVLEMLGLSSMVFALGIYLPLQLTTPILAGGFLSHLVNKRADKIDGENGKSIRERGIVLAGGLMAGGALGGVIGAALRVLPSFKEEWIQLPFYDNMPVSQTISALAFIGLCSIRLVQFVKEGEGGVMDQVSKYVADAVLGIDTLWGGDVMCPSGVGRFIADCWFSDEPLPAAYTHPAAARVRESGGVSGKNVDRAAIEEYLRAVDLPKAIAGIREEAGKLKDKTSVLRTPFLISMADCFEVMWDLAMEVLGKGKAVPYARCVESATGKAPEPSQPEKKRNRVAELLSRAGYASSNSGELLQAVDAWRRERIAPMACVRSLSAAVIAQFDNLSAKNLLPYLSRDLANGAARQY